MWPLSTDSEIFLPAQLYPWPIVYNSSFYSNSIFVSFLNAIKSSLWRNISSFYKWLSILLTAINIGNKLFGLPLTKSFLFFDSAKMQNVVFYPPFYLKLHSILVKAKPNNWLFLWTLKKSFRHSNIPNE